MLCVCVLFPILFIVSYLSASVVSEYVQYYTPSALAGRTSWKHVLYITPVGYHLKRLQHPTHCSLYNNDAYVRFASAQIPATIQPIIVVFKAIDNC